MTTVKAVASTAPSNPVDEGGSKKTPIISIAEASSTIEIKLDPSRDPSSPIVQEKPILVIDAKDTIGEDGPTMKKAELAGKTTTAGKKKSKRQKKSRKSLVSRLFGKQRNKDKEQVKSQERIIGEKKRKDPSARASKGTRTYDTDRVSNRNVSSRISWRKSTSTRTSRKAAKNDLQDGETSNDKQEELEPAKNKQNDDPGLGDWKQAESLDAGTDSNRKVSDKENGTSEDKDNKEPSEPNNTSGYLNGLFAPPKFDNVSGSVEGAASAIYTQVFGSTKTVTEDQKLFDAVDHSAERNGTNAAAAGLEAGTVSGAANAIYSSVFGSVKVEEEEKKEDTPEEKGRQDATSKEDDAQRGVFSKDLLSNTDTGKAILDATVPSSGSELSIPSNTNFGFLKAFLDPKSYEDDPMDLYEKFDKIVDVNVESNPSAKGPTPTVVEESTHENTNQKSSNDSESSSARQKLDQVPGKAAGGKQQQQHKSEDNAPKTSKSKALPSKTKMPGGIFFVGQRRCPDSQLEPVLLFASDQMLSAVGWDMDFLSPFASAGATDAADVLHPQKQNMPNVPALAHIDGKAFTCNSLKLANMLQTVVTVFYPDTSLFAQALTESDSLGHPAAPLVEQTVESINAPEKPSTSVGTNSGIGASSSSNVTLKRDFRGEKADRGIMVKPVDTTPLNNLPLNIPDLVDTFLSQARDSTIAIPFLDWLGGVVNTASDYYQTMEKEETKSKTVAVKRAAKEERLKRLEAELESLKAANERLRLAKTKRMHGSIDELKKESTV